MRNRTAPSIAISGAALLALALGAPVSARADGDEAAASQQAYQRQYEQMQERMQTMQTLMNQIHQTSDPAARQKLMDQQYQLMRRQMTDMGAMQGCMMGNAMAGQHRMDQRMMQPGTPGQPE